jgi:RND superfamily putative drug exporter
MGQEKVNSFGKLGRLTVKRKYGLIVAWIVLLVIVLPFVLNEKGINSLQMTTATGNNLESVKASNIINAEFPNTVPNNTMVVVISTSNASSMQTQEFINRLTSAIESNSSIMGIKNITSIFSILVPTLNQTNHAVYTAYNNANLTYNLLYSVPAIYMNVWSTAYNQTENSVLIPAVNQTNQGVYTAFYNANMTYNLLYGVPATYLNAWTQAYSQTQNITTANQMAYSQTASLLQQANPAEFNQYTLPLLNAFNASWCLSFQNPATQQYTPVQRAEAASTQTNQLYINKFLAGESSAQEFVTALTNTFSLEDFLTNNQAQNNAELQSFSIEYVANSSNASVEFVTAAYDLGTNPDITALTTLAQDIVWNPQAYNMGQEFIPTFNAVAYNQTSMLLNKANPSSFTQYTSHLLDLFNASWSLSFQDQATRNWSVVQRATAASEQSNPQFINAYFSNNTVFANGVASSLSLQDFLNGNEPQTNSILQNFSVSYVSNSSGLSTQLINATFNLGQNPDQAALQAAASNIIFNPQAYNVGQELNTLISSFVSPSNDITLLSITFNQSSNTNLLAIRGIIKSELAQEPADIKSALVTGTQALNYDFSQSTTHDLMIILPVTIALLLIATGLFFRSVITPLVTLGTIGIGLGIAQIFPYLVGTYINKIDYLIPTVLLTVMIGVGTDYGIFIIARHREERIYGLPVHQAIIKSITWAGESIATSGTTVIISFFSLSAASIILLQTLGLIVGAGIIVALCISLTFVPALIALLGDRVFWPNSGERFKRYAQSTLQKARKKTGYFSRSGVFAVKRAKIVVLVAILVTVPLLYIYATAAPTYDFLGGAPSNLESIIASRTLTSAFGGGRLSPTYVVVTFSQPIISGNRFNAGEIGALQAMSSHVANHGGVQEVTGPTMPYGTAVSYMTINSTSNPTTYNSILQSIGADNKSALLTVKLQSDPYSTQAINNVQDIRSSLHKNFDGTTGITGIYVGGTTGALLDTKNLFVGQFNIILPIVAVGVAIVLFIVLGSLFLPLFAVISVLMSIVWTLAVTSLVFQSAFNYGLLFIVPLMLFVLLLGLGMDYNIFILTRVREEASKGGRLNDAIVHAMEQTGGIISAAAIILGGSLGSLMLSNNLILKELGFAFMFSILVDALIVRTYLVPAVMSMMGKWSWYNPIKRLRRLKDIDTK